MKRKHALKLIANQLDFLNSKFKGVRTEFNSTELSCADVILTTLEHAGLIKPTHKKTVVRMCMMGTPYDDYVIHQGWEDEEE